jgi:putative ABC transport system ATP-binding protein
VIALELRDVVKRYEARGEAVRAVDGVSLCVQGGEFAAIYGPSGSGKTTLLQLAAALVTPDRGTVVFAGRDVTRLPRAESARFRRAEVGFVFQSFHLMPAATALDNAAVKLLADGLTLDDARREVRPWLERVGLGQRLLHTPGELSKGECQRVAIARALANEPRIVLADEPTGNLDSRRSREIMSLLREVSDERQIPIVLVTHDPEAAHVADRVYTLCDGVLREGSDVEPAGTADW